MSDETPKIQIDSDWKAQAQAEKEKLAEQSEQKPAAGAAGDAPGMPPATFETLLSTFITQALFALGAIPDPQTGQRMLALDLARHHIDMLTVLEEKTKGNVTEEEAETLTTAVYELRNQYVQVSAAARQAAAQGDAMPGQPPAPGAGPTIQGL